MPDKGSVVHFGKIDAVQGIRENTNFISSPQGNGEKAR